jgi:hypothetical protein
MSKHDEAVLETERRPAENAVPVARRINVAVNPIMLSAIDRVIEHEHVTLTEAVRRLIAYGDFVYEVTKERGATLVVHSPRGEERLVVLH